MSNIDKKGENLTRQTIPRDAENPEPHLSTGYPEQPETPPEGFYIPPCGIVDCDSAVKRLFNKDLPFTMKIVNGANGPIYLKKPAVIFAGGERFAMVKRLRPVRDKNGALILPAISIRNTGIAQTYEDMSSRGINQTTGELVIRRRFDPSDVDYQGLLNKIGLKNRPDDGSSTDRMTGENAKDLSIQQGMLLDQKLGNNVWEIIAIPQPQYITCTYEIVLWTTHIEHMNYMIETLLASTMPQVKGFWLSSDSGYRFAGYLEDSFDAQDNFEDYTEEKRLVRRSFTMRVLGYILAPDGSNRMVPIKRYISAPTISFDVQEGEVITKKQQEAIDKEADPFLLDNVEGEEIANKQTPTTEERFLLKKDVFNPITGKNETKYIRIDERNGRETVYTASDPAILEQFLFPTRNR